MPERELRKLVSELRAELARSETLDEDSCDRLRAAVAEIEDLIERSADATREERVSRSRSLMERLTSASKQFESSHPLLVEAVGRVVDTLAKLGI